MKRKFFCVSFVLCVALVCAAPNLHAQDGLKGALAQARLDQPFRLRGNLFEHRVAAADFDNDRRPDGAVLLNSDCFSRNSFRIELHLSGSNNTQLTFESTESVVSVAAWDINHDGAADVIVEQGLTHRRLFVWLGDGHGGFRKGRIEDFPSNERIAASKASIRSPGSRDSALYVPPQYRFGTTLLKASSISGRPPSTEEAHRSRRIDSPAVHFLALIASRAPPLSQSL